MDLKGFPTIAAILIVASGLAIASAVIYFGPESGASSMMATTPPANTRANSLPAASTTWATYTNKYYGYQVQYPAGAKIIEHPPGGTAKVQETDFDLTGPLGQTYPTSTGDSDEPGLHLLLEFRTIGSVIQNPRDLSAADWEKQQIQAGPAVPAPFSSQVVGINGVPAYHALYGGEVSGAGSYIEDDYYFVRGDNLLTVEGVMMPQNSALSANDPYSPYVQKYIPVFNTMVRSLTFPPTSSAVIASTSTPAVSPSCAFSAEVPVIVLPQVDRLTWICNHVTACTITSDQGDNFGYQNSSGSLQVQPQRLTNYNLICIGANGATASSSVKVAILKTNTEFYQP